MEKHILQRFSFNFYLVYDIKIIATYCGCGALKVKPDYGELKSFFVEPQFRGNGIASLIMQEILRTSRELNINSLKLETGIGLDNALNLYKRFNFELCEPFGKYFENGFSIFMKRDLP